MAKIAALYQQLPKRKQPATQAKAKVLREGTNSNDSPMGHTVSVSTGNGPPRSLSSPKQKSSKSRKDKSREKKLSISSRTFNLERERPEILQTLASASVASTNLLNALKLVNRETTRVSEDAECINRFEICKKLRHRILRYIQFIESEEFLGGLIHANEELVDALMAFEVLDKSLDYDSDSDDDVLSGNWRSKAEVEDEMNSGFNGLSINPAKPPRPGRPTSLPVASSSQHTRQIFESESEEEEEEEDENNPFGDSNAIKTPAVEQTGYTWYVSAVVFRVDSLF